MWNYMVKSLEGEEGIYGYGRKVTFGDPEDYEHEPIISKSVVDLPENVTLEEYREFAKKLNHVAVKQNIRYYAAVKNGCDTSHKVAEYVGVCLDAAQRACRNLKKKGIFNLKLVPTNNSSGFKNVYLYGIAQ